MKVQNNVECGHCGEFACTLTTLTPEYSVWACTVCGFQTNSALREGSEFYQAQMESLPTAYKEISITDPEGKVWVPSVINEYGSAMLFLNVPSPNPEDWRWTVYPYIPIPEDERDKYPLRPDGKPSEFKTDRTQSKTFGVMEYTMAFSEAFLKDTLKETLDEQS